MPRTANPKAGSGGRAGKNARKYSSCFFNTEEFPVMPSEDVCLSQEACGCVRHGERACLCLTSPCCSSG
ncbi:hypothetical protein AV530_004965 [Patagioenas fasciata monilis]|uniref:Uncharacterized protein n=1 Tax=Patagioenas fasciata monilis TaxID=372326 RepID=A0A1V4K3H7_PATFA|nr:hypothetical protein AV530_004965 [Patagioenas fasciata monilis]